MFAKTRNFVCTILARPPAYKRPLFQPRLQINMEINKFTSNLPDASKVKVQHDPVSELFHIEFDDCRAFLEYQKEGDTIRIMHTEVPKKFEGKGYGKVLAQAALKHIDEHKYQAESYCDYFSHYVQKYEPKYLKYFKK